jgi:WD40 repeat protein
MITGRNQASSTLLPQGKILIVGGKGDDPTAAEVYDPATGTFSAVGHLSTGRYLANAALLPNGLVLVAGGLDDDDNSLASAELYDPATGTFAPTGTLATARAAATATVLPGGKVLFTGGTASGPLVVSAELYDPATGTFTPAGNMTTGRAAHNATLLPDGKVLITGGFGPGGLSAELYDPATGMFTPAGMLTVPRTDSTATLLPSGKVLIAGGAGPGGANAELYDPATGMSMPTGSMLEARFLATATLLPGGQVLIAGGAGTTGILASAEIYDPDTGSFHAVGPMATGRYIFTATLLPDGRVLVAGGLNGDALSSAELFDPSSYSFSATGDMQNRRHQATATLLPDGTVLMAGGKGGDRASAEIYDPATGAFAFTGSLHTGRNLAIATLLSDGQVLIVGGQDPGSNSLASTERYDPIAGEFAVADDMEEGRVLAASALLPSGKVLVVGGMDTAAVPLASAELYDPAADSFQSAGTMATGRSAPTATLLTNGKVLVAGGFGAPGLSTEIYDPATATFAEAGSLTSPRAQHTATLLPNGKVLIAGGAGGGGSTAEIYDPATDSSTVTGNLHANRANAMAVLLPNGKVLIAGGTGSNGIQRSAEVYDPATGTFEEIGDMTAPRYWATATLLANGRVLIAGGPSGTALQSAELLAVDTGFPDDARPTLDALPASVEMPGRLNLSGSGFRGTNRLPLGAIAGSEGSGGGTVSNSATNYPLLRLRRLDNDQEFFLRPDPETPWSDMTFESEELVDLPGGYYSVTIVVNAIPSESRMVSLVGEEPDTSPVVIMSFAPENVTAGAASGLTITLGNANNSDDAVLESELINLLPPGLFVANPPQASTTCGNGTVTAMPGNFAIVLGNGSIIPGAGSCTVTVDVAAPVAGEYVNVIPAGALQTDQGSNATAAEATLVVDLAPIIPVIVVEPTKLDFSIDAGTSDSQPLVIGNLGNGMLDWTIHFSTDGREGENDVVMSQTGDLVVAPSNSIACPSGETRLLRRFYFGEHAGATGTIDGVRIGVQEVAANQELTINLYALAHGAPVDTIPTADLDLIGTGTTQVSAGDENYLLTVPVSGTVADTTTTDLVVEVVSDTGAFFIGATTADETHPGFILAPGCGSDQPTPIRDLGPQFAFTRIIITANTIGIPDTCDTPATVPWLSVTPASGSTVPDGDSVVDVEADAAQLVAGSYAATLCIDSNDPVTPRVHVPLVLIVLDTAEPAIEVTPGALDFGKIPVGQASDPQSVVLRSIGTAPVHVTTIDVAAAPFSRADGDCPDLPFTLEVGQECALSYRFTPVEAGAFDQTISMATNADPVTVSLAGQGIVDHDAIFGDGFDGSTP